MAQSRQDWLLVNGVWVPWAQITSEGSSVERVSPLRLKQQALELEALFSSAGVPLPPTSSLRQLLEAAKRAGDAYLLHTTIDRQEHYTSLHFQRVADPVLRLRGVSDPTNWLWRLTQGTLNFFDRGESDAKACLWEIEVWSMLLDRGLEAVLGEPDVHVQLGKHDLGFACKKVNSAKNVRKSLQEAVHQIEGSRDFGIAAYNLDELIPEGQLWKGQSVAHARESLERVNWKFLGVQERYFKRYMQPSRIIAALVSTSCVAGIPGGHPEFNNVSAPDFWVLPTLAGEPLEVIERLKARLLGE